MPEPKIVYTEEDGAVLQQMTAGFTSPQLESFGCLRYLSVQDPALYYKLLSEWLDAGYKYCQLYRDLMFRVPLSKLPIHINHVDEGVRLLVKWRLKIGK